METRLRKCDLIFQVLIGILPEAAFGQTYNSDLSRILIFGNQKKKNIYIYYCSIIIYIIKQFNFRTCSAAYKQQGVL